MKPQARGHVEFQIGVMHAVQPPQGGHGVEHHMLEIDGEIEREQRPDEDEPNGRLDDIEETPAPRLRRQRKPDSDNWERQSKKHRVGDDDTKIVGPADTAGNLPPPARRRRLPRRHNDEDSKKEGDADCRFIRQECVGHGRRSLVWDWEWLYIQVIN
ncbi:hypothetical protein JCM17846_32630 [Iodidimonas nitroreducens]|uniref:Uncharacterized protein n=1 Tax=Iodidimonas nitroreducens TaxID=1236968 RepID=A0A5A7NB28_9PROT|nr:hypothetical protein JCM17846_32630 [Iodidimonas nitroreducens]